MLDELDVVNVLELFKICFGSEMSLEGWQWRFRNNVCGHGIVALAMDGQKICSHYAVSPCVVHTPIGDVVSGLSGTTMTHPSCRGMGLFTLLAEYTYNQMVSQDMPFVWGFPNSASHRGFVRDLNWADIYEVPTFRYDLKNATPDKSPVEVVNVQRFDHTFDDLWRRASSAFRFAVRRDALYLNWRYGRGLTTGRYEVLALQSDGVLAGYAVIQRYNGDVQIVDILYADWQAGLDIVRHIIKKAALEKSLGVALWLNVNTPLHLELERIGFKNTVPITYFSGKLLKDEDKLRGLTQFSNWYITMGDSDVY